MHKIKKLENHPSIVEIKKSWKNTLEKITIKEATVSYINTLKSVNTKTATGSDNILPKLVKLSVNASDSNLCNVTKIIIRRRPTKLVFS